MARIKLFKKLKFYTCLIIVILLGVWYFSGEGGNLKPENSSSELSGNGKLMSVSFLDIGQGDCTFVNLPDGKTLLVDAANSGDGDEIAAYLKKNGAKKLDYIVATHPHADHIGGMAEVISSFEVGQIFAPKIASSDIPTTKAYENFLLSVKDKGLKITTAKGGSTLFEGEGYKADCFAPNKEKNEGLNNYSIVFKLTYGKNTFLFTGDAERELESEILYKKYNLSADVLKVGHHGSSSSTTPKFLKAVSPDYAVISCGKDNSYSHPHTETVDILLENKVKIFRTDKDKTVTAICSGDSKISFKTGEIGPLA